MAFEKAYDYLSQRGFGERVRTFSVSSATVELTPEELERITAATWVDVCVPMTEKQP